jgi:hypothetical protein
LNTGLALARYVFYHLCHTPSPFCFSNFSDRVSLFLLGWASAHNPPTYASCKGGVIDLCHHTWPIFTFLDLLRIYSWFTVVVMKLVLHF